MRDGQFKIEIFNNQFAVAGSGSAGAIDCIIDNVHERFEKSKSLTIKKFVELCEDAAYDYLKRYKERFEASDEDFDQAVLAVTSCNKIYQVFYNGSSQEETNYGCIGSSDLYAEYILKQLYEPNVSLEQATEWAIYIIKQASEMDNNVGGPIRLIHLTTTGSKNFDSDDLKNIENKISGLFFESQRDLLKLIDEIVSLRKQINEKIQPLFKNKIIESDELAIWHLTRPVITEQDFTDRILALSLLIDKMNIPKIEKMEKGITNRGTIDLLESWLTSENLQYDENLIKLFRDLKILRSKHFPVHPDDAKFIEVVLKWGFSFPPDWSKLYLASLNKYIKALKLLNSINYKKED